MTHYGLLAVSIYDDAKTIKTKYNEKMNQIIKSSVFYELYMPELNEIMQAYNTLANSEKRRTYDSYINDMIKEKETQLNNLQKQLFKFGMSQMNLSNYNHNLKNKEQQAFSFSYLGYGLDDWITIELNKIKEATYRKAEGFEEKEKRLIYYITSIKHQVREQLQDIYDCETDFPIIETILGIDILSGETVEGKHSNSPIYGGAYSFLDDHFVLFHGINNPKEKESCGEIFKAYITYELEGMSHNTIVKNIFKNNKNSLKEKQLIKK